MWRGRRRTTVVVMTQHTELAGALTMTHTHPPAIELIGLRKAFPSRGDKPVQAVDGIDLVVQPGEIVAFLGPNGAGKTTTVDMLLGLSTDRKSVV